MIVRGTWGRLECTIRRGGALFTPLPTVRPGEMMVARCSIDCRFVAYPNDKLMKKLNTHVSDRSCARRTLMRKLVASFFISLDGVVQGPGPGDDFELAGWTMPYWD